MRIISGKHKGRRIQAPKKLPVRPTTDMAKEALFNILNNYYNFTELKVLELFAGTGNISYEFASRGSRPIIAVDGDLGCVNFIKKIATDLELDITVHKSDAFMYLEKSKSKFDVIFADPPYSLTQEEFEKVPLLVFEKDLLESDGMFIIEHSKETKLAHLPHFSFSKSYGGTIFTFFELAAEEEDFKDEEE